MSSASTPGTTGSSAAAMAAPIVARRPITRSHHGIEVTDEFEWLRDREDPEVIGYLEAENAWTEQQTAHLAGLREQIFGDIRARTQETDLDVPRLVVHTTGSWGRGYWYYARTQEGLQYRVHCRVPAADGSGEPVVVPDAQSLAAGGQEQVLLDENVEATGQEFFSLGRMAVSPSGRFVAFLADVTGGEVYRLVVRHAASGETIGRPVEGVHGGLAWLGDDTLFYTVPDAAWRPHQVCRLTVSTGEQSAVFTEDDERFNVRLTTSRDGSAVLIGLHSTLTSEWRMITANDVDGEPAVITPRRDGVDYRVEHAGDRLLILHNDRAEDFELAQAPLTARSVDDWAPVIVHRPGVRLTGVDAYTGHVVVSLRRDGLTGLDISNRDTHGNLTEVTRSITPDESLYTLRHQPGANITDTWVRYLHTSLVTPPTVAEFDTVTGRTTTVKVTPVRDHPRLGPYRPADYLQRREWATASDGTRVPLSIVHRTNALDAGPAPALLYGYGSYESCQDPMFSTERLALLDRGVVYAIAHVRGGGEMGRQWYLHGRTLTKKNTFTDFVAVADRLMALGYTAPDRLAAAGRSAGGLLMGVIANLAPEKFRAIHAGVPFVDPLTTCLNPDYPLIVNEWEEWGNPLHDPRAYTYIASYAPYDNVAKTTYPAILATTSLNDIRVYYTEPAKWIARLRIHATNSPERPILLKTEMSAGHAGASGRYGAWQQTAFEYSWILNQIGGYETSRPV